MTWMPWSNGCTYGGDTVMDTATSQKVARLYEATWIERRRASRRLAEVDDGSRVVVDEVVEAFARYAAPRSRGGGDRDRGLGRVAGLRCLAAWRLAAGHAYRAGALRADGAARSVRVGRRAHAAGIRPGPPDLHAGLRRGGNAGGQAAGAGAGQLRTDRARYVAIRAAQSSGASRPRVFGAVAGLAGVELPLRRRRLHLVPGVRAGRDAPGLRGGLWDGSGLRRGTRQGVSMAAPSGKGITLYGITHCDTVKRARAW